MTVEANKYEKKLIELCKADPRIMILTAENRAAMRVLPDIIPEQFEDVGIAEQTMIGMAAGMALRGRLPIVHALSAFLTMRAFEFIRTDVGISGLPVKLVGCVPGLLSDGNGPTHQAVEDISLMQTIPGMEVFCPADIDELVSTLPAIMKRPNPCYIRYTQSEPFCSHSKPLDPTQIETWGDKGKTLILSHGVLLKEAFEAQKILVQKNTDCVVANVRMVSPLNRMELKPLIEEAEHVVVVEDHFEKGGLYASICQFVVEHQLMRRVTPITLGDKWFTPAMLNDVLVHEKFTGSAIAERIIAI